MSTSTFPLTARQKDVLDVYEFFVETEGISPTLDEVAQVLGVSKVTVLGHVNELIRKGALVRRGIRSSRSVAFPRKGRRKLQREILLLTAESHQLRMENERLSERLARHEEETHV